jgi:cystathionine beta-lyase
MSGSVGLLSFVPKMQDESKIMRFMDSLKVYQLGVSWGGFESLAVMLQMKPLVWEEPKWVVRLYCGLESSDDLLSDLQQAAQHLS